MESSQPMEGKRVSKIIIRPYDWHSNKNPHRVYRAAKKKVISSAQGGRMASQEVSENLGVWICIFGLLKGGVLQKKSRKKKPKKQQVFREDGSSFPCAFEQLTEHRDCSPGESAFTPCHLYYQLWNLSLQELVNKSRLSSFLVCLENKFFR